jgi:two-component system response regulator MtrA
MDRILIVEDDQALGSQIVSQLQDAGFEPTWLTSGAQAMDVTPGQYSLLILDLMLPGAHGLDVLKHLRSTSDLPVLILSARNDTHDKVRALGLGADDYLTKPFWPEELVARVKARLRRPLLHRADTISCGDLVIDVAGRSARLGEDRIELTRVEFDLLVALARRPGAAVSRSWLAEHVLDPDREGGERTLDVHASRLRKKLGPSGPRILTVWGVGYRMEAPEAS